MADFLDEKRKEIQARLKELKPAVEEYQLLQAADVALGGLGNGGTESAAAAPATARRRRRASAAASSGRRGRPRGSGTRAAQALDLVRERPGITIPELAEAMGIQQNYLYRVLPGLAEDGKVTKSGRGWHLKEPRPPAS
jgi:CRP-like cAMP-binding protein